MKQGLGFGLNKTNYIAGLEDILIAECDNVNDFTDIYSCAKQLDIVNKNSGTGSIKLTKNSDIVGYFTADIAGLSLDLSKHTSFEYQFYTADKSNIATVSTTIFTTIPFDYGISFIHFAGWEIVNGWNVFTIPFSSFTKHGAANLATTKAIRFTVNLIADNNTEVVNFDRVRVIST